MGVAIIGVMSLALAVTRDGPAAEDAGRRDDPEAELIKTRVVLVKNMVGRQLERAPDRRQIGPLVLLPGMPPIILEIRPVSPGDRRPDDEDAPTDRDVGIASRSLEEYFDFEDILGPLEVGGRVKLEKKLTSLILELRGTRDLTEEQTDKLRLAGHGDIMRLFHRIDQCRREFGGIRWDLEEAAFYLKRRVTPVRLALMRGPFGEGSLFRKTLDGLAPDAGGPREGPLR